MKMANYSDRSESEILERFGDNRKSVYQMAKRLFIIVNILLSVILETANVLFDDRIVSDGSKPFVGALNLARIAISDCPQDKKWDEPK